MAARVDEEELIGYLRIDVEDDQLMTDLVNEIVPVEDIVCFGGILHFIKKLNKEYCEAFDLCPVCRQSLKHGSCPDGCL